MKALPLDKGTQDKIKLLATHDPGSLSAVAALLDCPEPKAQAFLVEHGGAIDKVALRMALTGDMLEPKARRLAEKLLDRMMVDVDSLDPLEAADLIKHPLRILENADRVRARSPDDMDKLPVFNFVFHAATGPVSATLVPPADVVDVTARQIEGGTDDQ